MDQSLVPAIFTSDSAAAAAIVTSNNTFTATDSLLVPQAANAVPPNLGTTAVNHPPYAEMIFEAIGALKERNGSSKRAIVKYIERVYPGLPATISAVLTHHLKRLKNSGALVMVKKSYKLPRSDGAPPLHDDNVPSSTADPSGPKRGRGRPLKPKPDAQPVLIALGLVDEPVKRTARGRPRKSVNVGVEKSGSESGKRGPGRPPKSGLLVGQSGESKRRSGRPPKPKSILLGPRGPKRGPGRPPKNQATPTLVPYASSVSADSSIQNVDAAAANAAAPAAAVNSNYSGAAGKRRGRPRKGSLVTGVSKPKKLSKKPVGRPKKIASRAITEASAEQWVAAYGDAKRKLEYYQSKMDQVVGVLKLELNSNSTIGTVAAIQELERLATMDINAPLVQEEVQPPFIQT